MWGMELADIRSLKQHVIVNHRLPEYCPICYSIFESAAERDRHIVARSCRGSTNLSSYAASRLVGVSEDQVGQLLALEERTGTRNRNGKRTKGGRWLAKNKTTRTAAVSEEEEWYRIWQVLFPGEPRPRLAYLSSRGEREMVDMRNFWDRAGPGLLADLLKAQGLLQWEDLQEETALAALHASVLKGMVETARLIGND
jgi:hypothetical protein